MIAPSPGLLVSVRSVAEAGAALAGGAHLIDVKEPSRGPLGAADREVIVQVARRVAGRRPVSAALGELADRVSSLLPLEGVSYVKCGLAGCARHLTWQAELEEFLGSVQGLSCRPVVVAYADWQRAEAPPFHEVCAFACRHRRGPFLLDTWGKDGTTLLDWIATKDVRILCESCRCAGVAVALAGSLGTSEMQLLRPLAPDWFAVRGSACRSGDRGREIDEGAVRQLVRYCSGLDSAKPAGSQTRPLA